MNLEGEIIYKILVGFGGGYLLWAKKEDKKKLDKVSTLNFEFKDGKTEKEIDEMVSTTLPDMIKKLITIVP